MRACESAKDGTASQHDKTARIHGADNLRIDIWDLPRRPRYLIRTPFGPTGCQQIALRAENRRQNASWLHGPSSLNHPLGTGPDGIDHGCVSHNALQNRHYGGHFLEIIPAGHFLHALQLVVQRQLLIAMEILQSASKFQRCGKALEQLRNLLHRDQGE